MAATALQPSRAMPLPAVPIALRWGNQREGPLTQCSQSVLRLDRPFHESWQAARQWTVRAELLSGNRCELRPLAMCQLCTRPVDGPRGLRSEANALFRVLRRIAAPLPAPPRWKSSGGPTNDAADAALEG